MHLREATGQIIYFRVSLCLRHKRIPLLMHVASRVLLTKYYVAGRTSSEFTQPRVKIEEIETQKGTIASKNMGEIANPPNPQVEGVDSIEDIRQIRCTFILGRLKEEMIARKDFLSGKSPVFKEMFFGPEPVQGRLDVPDIEPDVFGKMLHFIDTNNVEFENLTKAFRVCYAAHKYQIQGLLKACVDYLHPESVEDSFIALESSVQFDIRSLGDAAMKIVRENTPKVFRSSQFMKLSQAAVLKIIKDDGLNIAESEVLQICVLWARYQCKKLDKKPDRKNLRAELGNIFSYIRFFLLVDTKYFSRPGSSLLSVDEVKYLTNCLGGEREEAEFRYICQTREPRNGAAQKEVENIRAAVFSVVFANHISDSVTCLIDIARTCKTFVFNETWNLLSVVIPSRLHWEDDNGKIFYDEDITISIVETDRNTEQLIGQGRLTGKQPIGKLIYVPLHAKNHAYKAPIVKAGYPYRIEVLFNMRSDKGHYPYPFCKFATFKNLLNIANSNSFIIGFQYCK